MLYGSIFLASGSAAPSVKHGAERGSALIEFSLTILPVMALLLMTMDIAWTVFARATLQEAVRQGVRYGVTGQVSPAGSCVGSSVRNVVSQYSFGFVPASRASSLVSVKYYSATTLTEVTGAGATAGGNVIQVTVSNVSIRSFGPIFRTAGLQNIGATASDVMESPPNGSPACP